MRQEVLHFQTRMLGGYYGALVDSQKGSKTIVYGDDNAAYSVAPDPKSGGLKLTPVTLPDGTQFKGSKKSTGAKDPKEWTEQEKIAYQAYQKDVTNSFDETNPPTSADLIDLAATCRISLKVCGL